MYFKLKLFFHLPTLIVWNSIVCVPPRKYGISWNLNKHLRMLICSSSNSLFSLSSISTSHDSDSTTIMSFVKMIQLIEIMKLMILIVPINLIRFDVFSYECIKIRLSLHLEFYWIFYMHCMSAHIPLPLSLSLLITFLEGRMMNVLAPTF